MDPEKRVRGTVTIDPFAPYGSRGLTINHIRVLCALHSVCNKYGGPQMFKTLMDTLGEWYPGKRFHWASVYVLLNRLKEWGLVEHVPKGAWSNGHAYGAWKTVKGEAWDRLHREITHVLFHLET